MTIPDFNGGGSSARQKLNAIVREVNRSLSIRGDEQFIRIHKEGGGLVVSLDIDRVMSRARRVYPEVADAKITAVESVPGPDSGDANRTRYTIELGHWDMVGEADTWVPNEYDSGGTTPLFYAFQPVDTDSSFDEEDYVEVVSRGVDTDTGQLYFTVIGGSGGGGLWGLLSNPVLLDGQQARWIYEFEEIDDTAWLADGGCVILPGGRNGFAENTIENRNPAGGSGRMGTGHYVSPSEFTAGVKEQPIEGDKAVVWLRRSRNCDGDVIYRFEGYNSKAECPA